MKCKICGYSGDDFYSSNKSKCKPCVRAAAKKNREDKLEYYREYDAKRYREDPRVRDRLDRYQKTPAGIAASNKAKLKYARTNPIKRGAAVMVGNAVRDGKLEKSYSCSECGSGGRIHGHHDDYAKPLEVRWLCGKCHKQWHRDNGEGANC